MHDACATTGDAPPPLCDEAALLRALRAGDAAAAILILAGASGLPAGAVRHAVERRSARALVSIVWRSGFTMRAALTVQVALGQLPDSDRLHPGRSPGDTLSRAAMEWQLGLILRHAAAPGPP